MEPESDDEPDAGPPVYQAPFCCACGVQVSDREDRELYTFFHEGRRIPSLWASFYRASKLSLIPSVRLQPPFSVF